MTASKTSAGFMDKLSYLDPSPRERSEWWGGST
jgi:hypothetical protein